MNAPVLLNSLNELGKSDKIQSLLSFRNSIIKENQC